jgi:hypothetical protein
MSSRTGNWMMAFGVLVGFVGLCMIPAGLGNHGDRSLLGLGAALVGVGALAAAAGIYLKALVLGSKLAIPAPSPTAANSNRRARGACDLCRKEMPVVHCKVHQFHLCGACLAEHYDFRACVYVPSTRRVETKGTRNMTAKAHA